MQYRQVEKATFLARPNRFIAHVELAGERVVCHVKNTGRCRELLTPGAEVWLEKGSNPGRKTAWDLIAVQKGEHLINMDAQAPNKVFAEWAAQWEPELTALRRKPPRSSINSFRSLKSWAPVYSSRKPNFSSGPVATKARPAMPVTF